MYERTLGDKLIQTTDYIDQKRPAFHPTIQEQDFINKVYSDFVYDYSLKNQGWQVLGSSPGDVSGAMRTLNQFWDDCNYDYNQSVLQQQDNQVLQYSSGISRDKANVLITGLTKEYSFPSVRAFDENNHLDSNVSMVSRPLLRWQYINDGRPSESGKSKSFRYTHKQTVEGTVHILDIVGADGRLKSQVMPNEEVFIPNFYQPDVQLQSHFMWVQQWASYAEAEAEFGDLPNFQYVQPGNLGWINETYEYKERYKALVYANQCTIVRCWYPVRETELKRLIKIGKLPKGTKKAKYYNVIINGVNMFPYDNLMPYHHGDYPITKAVYEYFSPAEFYWGNSAVNKMAQDKLFRDGWLTLTRFVAKLQSIPSFINASGQHLENDVYVPGQTIDLPANTDPNKFFPVPGTDKPGIIRDLLAMMQQTDSEIDRESAAPLQSGLSSGTPNNARVVATLNERATEILMGLAQRIAEREEARAFPILKATFQFLPRQTIKQLSIPDVVFPDGTQGELEVIFKKLPKLTEDQQMEASYKLLEREFKQKKKGKNVKQVFLDPGYIQNLDLFCEALAEDLPRLNSSFKTAEAEHKWQTYLAAPPGTFNLTAAARNLVRAFGDNEKEMILGSGSPMPQLPPGMPGALPPGQGTLMRQPNPAALNPVSPTGLTKLNPPPNTF